MEEQLRANAELVRKVARDSLGVEIGYDEQGVEWLDEYIDHQRENGNPETVNKLPNTLGSFLGECVRATYGGDWLRDEQGGLGVRINGKLTVFPFNKVRKQLESAGGESVLAFFRTIAALLRGK